MVATIDDLMQTVRSNPFIDGIGYFIEVTTSNPISDEQAATITERMRERFCEHCDATLDGDRVVGLDFHEHIFTSGDDGEYFVTSLERLLKGIEQDVGIDHLCIEFQFDFTRAKKAATEVDELLQP